MPNQTFTCEVDVVMAANTAAFPATGDDTKWYFDLSSGDYDAGSGTLYYWNGSSYSTLTLVGPRPHKPPHH